MAHRRDVARWSSDGTQIVCMDPAEKVLMVYDVVQSEERLLHDGNYERIEPGFDWSPDGKRVAMIGTNDSQNKRELVILRTDGTDAKVRLTDRGLEGTLGWSPDGKRLALAIGKRICLLPVDSAQPPQFLPAQTGQNTDPAWSPDGQWIAFASDRE